MPELADILRACSPGYLAKYGLRMLPSHKRAARDITLCRTRPMGGKTYFCQPCDEYHYSYHSCKNRSCPKCGNDDATRWLKAQNANLLPVEYFLVTSTLPGELRLVAHKNQKLIYGLLMSTTAAAISKLALDPKFVGGQIGMLGVLQTWKRDMGYHVHTHFIAPGGGVPLPDSKLRWLPTRRQGFLVPEKAVAKILRAKFRDALKKHPEVFSLVPQSVWRKDWVVNIKPVGKGESTLKYLATYIFRIAISNNRIEKFEDGKVTFRYKDNEGNWHRLELGQEEFIIRFLQHVLPHRFVKVRYYGYLSPRKRDQLEGIKELFNGFVSKKKNSASGNLAEGKVRIIPCPKCGKPMLFVMEIKPSKYDCRSP
jgi:hypothetical protein